MKLKKSSPNSLCCCYKDVQQYRSVLINNTHFYVLAASQIAPIKKKKEIGLVDKTEQKWNNPSPSSDSVVSTLRAKRWRLTGGNWATC